MEFILCVSAGASFALSAFLVPVGAYCVMTSLHRDRTTLPLAAIPWLFAVQQLSEGLVWVGIDRGNVFLTNSAAVVYLFFALMFWLIWIPLCALALESRRRIRIVLELDTIVGLAGGLLIFLPIALYPQFLEVTVVRHSISYGIPQSPALTAMPQFVWHTAYVGVVSLPFVLVAHKRKSLIAFSLAMLSSAVFSHINFWYSFASVWCFFAASISILLGLMFHTLPYQFGRGCALSTSSPVIRI